MLKQGPFDVGIPYLNPATELISDVTLASVFEYPQLTLLLFLIDSQDFSSNLSVFGFMRLTTALKFHLIVQVSKRQTLTLSRSKPILV